MDFKTSVTTCFTKYIDFSGRASRSEYWWFQLFYLIVYLIAFMIKPQIAMVVGLVFILPIIAATVRRLHDIGKSGWYYFIALIPAVGVFILLYWLVQESAIGANEYGN